MEALTIRDFSFAYPDACEKVLSDVNMRVEEGAVCLLIGDSGSGKTTLLKNICPSLIPAGSRDGVIEVCGNTLVDALGESINDYESTPLLDRALVGFVHQDPDNQIVCDKVWRELAFGLECLGIDVALMHRRVAEVASYFGLVPIFNSDCASLSGGQKQSLNLASAIASNPKLLLLDEPTAQLDPISSRRLTDMVRQINSSFDITIVIATHSPELFTHIATCAYEIVDGRVHARDLRCEMSDRYCNADGTAPIYPADPQHNSKEEDLAINIKNASFSYCASGHQVMNQLSIHICSGSVVSLVGSNGCGKTTLLKIMAGILKPQSGNVENKLETCQAYLPQDVNMLFSKETVAEELMEWSKSAGYSYENAIQMAARLSIENTMDLNPLDLSFGQRQKLGIAKLLLCQPKLILLDEPVKGLDGSSQLEIARIICDLSDGGTTVVIATHDLAFASRVSNIMALVFDGGIACAQNSKSFCEGNIFYTPNPTQFSMLWDSQNFPDEERDR